MQRIDWALPLLLVALLASASPAEEVRDPAAREYARYCSACHGEGGRGDGVVSHMMTPKPTDLTTLSARHENEFPYARVMEILDGRQPVRAHGDSAMPVWGDLFRADAGYAPARNAVIRGKLMLVIDHLVVLQP